MTNELNIYIWFALVIYLAITWKILGNAFLKVYLGKNSLGNILCQWFVLIAITMLALELTPRDISFGIFLVAYYATMWNIFRKEDFFTGCKRGICELAADCRKIIS